jgi:hypothetical protein
LNVSELTDDQIARLLERYRGMLDALDWEPRFETTKSYRAHLRSQIRLLQGEQERRRT